MPIYEPGLAELVARNAAAGRLHFTTDLAAAVRGRPRSIFLAVGTPPADDGSVDLSALWAVVDELAPHLRPDAIVVSRARCRWAPTPAVTARLQRADRPASADVASNPEFLKEGAAIDDFMKPDRVVVGMRDAGGRATCCATSTSLTCGPTSRCWCMSPESAEMTKYVANALLATKISFINEMANLCERAGADINEVRRGIGHDSRIGFAFLFPGVGYGGSCFPKDVRALAAMARAHGVEPRILDAVARGQRPSEDGAVRKDRAAFRGQAGRPDHRPSGDWPSSPAPTTSARPRRWC